VTTQTLMRLCFGNVTFLQIENRPPPDSNPATGGQSTRTFAMNMSQRSITTPRSALVFGLVGVQHALNGLVDLVEDEDAG
jgi:hypothetical protein